MLTEVKLDQIDLGSLLERADQELQKICEDVARRPTLDKARSVTIEVRITPRYDAQTRKNFPDIDWSVKHAMPGHKGMTTKAFVSAENRVLMSTNDPLGELPGQNNLLDEMEGAGPHPVKALHNGTQH